MSELLALVFRIEERQFHHGGLDYHAVLDTNRNLLPWLALIERGVGQTDDLVQGLRVLAGRHVAADVPTAEHQMAFQRLRTGLGQRETHQFAFLRLGFEDVKEQFRALLLASSVSISNELGWLNLPNAPKM